MKVMGQIEDACIEQLASDPSANTQGRIFTNTTSGQTKIDDGVNKRALLRNDEKMIVGNSGTAANNVRIKRAGNGLFQIVPASDTSLDGVISLTPAEMSLRLENYTDAGKPAFGNPGRAIYVTDLFVVLFDTGSAWVPTSGIVDGTITFPKLDTDIIASATAVTPASGDYVLIQDISDSNLTKRALISDVLGASPLVQSQTLAGAGNFTVPANVTSLFVFLCGGGGGGGGGGDTNTVGGASSGGAGGEGAPFVMQRMTVTPGQVIAYSVGTAGTLGAKGTGNGDGSSGGTGGTTTFGALTALGGAGGAKGLHTNPSSIVYTSRISLGADGGYSGAAGKGSPFFAGGSAGTTEIGAVGGGGGGASWFGAGGNGSNGRSGVTPTAAVAASAGSFGAGGGGGGAAVNGTTNAADGAPGIVGTIEVVWIKS